MRQSCRVINCWRRIINLFLRHGQKVLFEQPESLTYGHKALLEPLWEIARPAAEQVATQMLCRLPDCEANVQDGLHGFITRSSGSVCLKRNRTILPI